MGQQAVATGLRQQLNLLGLGVEFGGVDQHHRSVGAAGGGDHVAGVLLVAGGIADDELARCGAEVAVGDVDGDALLTLRTQAIGQQGQIGLTLALHACQLILQHRLGVDQEASDQGAFAVIDRAAGDEFKGLHQK